ncbi:hypothetical protein PPYR_10002 [Photinus pyralis]|uniref:Lipase domain-containing protein n=2 Tax=Photinus pyralis TaxID=7054 RepID=A0A5N4AF57_PHOPY|nr:phospholipase A1-like [Photinus pyralis]KAB0795941.1 hypothetical protein PPYR_10002 [Photinus pyralis]
MAFKLSVFLAIAFFSLLLWGNEGRRFLPFENDPYRIRNVYYYNGARVLVEDLTNAKLQARSDIPLTDLALYLYTRQGSAYKINMTQIKDLQISQFYQPKNENFFIIHGWKNSHLSEVNTLITKALLETSDINVFVLDWSKIASGLYTTAFLSVEGVGSHLANFIVALVREFQLDIRRVALVGHSLGAHIAGCAGAAVNGTLRYIVGLDPAGPLFSLWNTKNRLDKSDAEFVQVIHTAGGLAGMLSSIGHADYFPNDGTPPQPGCGMDLIGVCSHSQAYVYYSESLTRNGFAALNCSSYTMYREGVCAHQHLSYLGRLPIDKSANGDYYLDTNMDAPYGS